MRKFLRQSAGTIIAGFSNLDSWVHSSRTWIMLAALYLLCMTNALRDERAVQLATGSAASLNLGEIVFLQGFRGFNFGLSTMIFLVMMSTFPKRSAYQEYCMIRSDRRKWFHGQMIYAFIMCLLFMVLVILFTASFSAFHFPLSSGWGEFLLSGEASFYLNLFVPNDFLENMTPFTATLLVCLPTLLCWFSICMILMLSNLFGHPGAGIAAVAMLLISNYIFIQCEIPFYPLHYACSYYFYESDRIGDDTIRMLLFHLLVNGALYTVMRIRLWRMDIAAEGAQA